MRSMAPRVWVGPDGTRVEVIGLVRGGRRAWIRVTQGRTLVGRGYYRSSAEAAAVVDLASLVPAS